MALYHQLKFPSRLLFDRVGVFMADIIFTLLSLLLCLQTKENETQIPI